MTSSTQLRSEVERLEAQLHAFLRDECRIDPALLTRTTELVTSGLLDSMGMVRLATHIERLVDISIPDDDITAEHFDSIERILGYVESKLCG
ncbi:MAG: acyl carrier protein [Deltaproteobacteria bacterium]|nr:acyl carrier protein [Deltaproteobacteria bacterium]